MFSNVSNHALKHRCQESCSRDPILLNEIDESNEWLLGRMEGDSNDDDVVFEHGNSTVAAIAQGYWANGPRSGTRSRRSRSIITKSSEKDRRKAAAHASVSISSWAQVQFIDDGEEEEEYDEEEAEEEEFSERVSAPREIFFAGVYHHFLNRFLGRLLMLACQLKDQRRP